MGQNRFFYYWSRCFFWGNIFFFTTTSVNTREILEEKYEVEIVDGIYKQIVLEDFETISLSPRNILTFGKGKPELKIKNDFPSPSLRSIKYLSWSIPESVQERVRFVWEKPLTIEPHTKEIQIWVYSTQLPGSLNLLVKDFEQTSHRLLLGKLNFRGWKKLKVKMPESIFQADLYPNQKTKIYILGLQYEPGPASATKKRQLFYTDDLTAYVRNKYILPENRNP